jgi:uncharacterized membrane protein (DUF441 family)
MDVTNIVLLVFLALGLFGNNPTISIAVSILLLIRLVHAERLFPYLEQHGLHIGVIILTIGVLAPLASGKISPEVIWKTFTNLRSLLAVAVGVFVAYLGGRGAAFMTETPLAVTGILIGTIIGVTLFRGVPVGPLIAAGMLALVLQYLPK